MKFQLANPSKLASLAIVILLGAVFFSTGCNQQRYKPSKWRAAARNNSLPERQGVETTARTQWERPGFVGGTSLPLRAGGSTLPGRRGSTLPMRSWSTLPGQSGGGWSTLPQRGGWTTLPRASYLNSSGNSNSGGWTTLPGSSSSFGGSTLPMRNGAN